VKTLSRICIVLSALLFAKSALAIDPVTFDNPKDLERYHQLTWELRCPKCQNQNLIDSNSQISVDLRREVAQLIEEGKTDKEIKQHMVSLYGDFILYRPPVQKNTLILWAAPVVLLGVGVLIFGLIILRRSKLPDEDDLDDDVASGDAGLPPSQSPDDRTG
jgi:cytochrome c-type biogenesis protein CcmH